MDNLFPYDTIRDVQKDLMDSVKEAVYNRSHLVVHAPTGLGKTAASLPVALAHAIENKLTVFFLTSRHTQHKIAIETLREIKAKHDVTFTAVDLIGKKWMCAVPGADVLSSSEFGEFCKGQRETQKCEFFNNTRSGLKLKPKAKYVFKNMMEQGILENDKVLEVAADEKLCPYEMGLELAKEAHVIIGDYFHIFNENVRKNLFNRADKEIGSCILIIDEGHNLPNRVRDLMSHKLNDYILERAIKEVKKYGFEDTERNLRMIYDIMKNYEKKLEGDEMLVEKDNFVNNIRMIKNYEEFVADLFFIADDILEKQKSSFVLYVATFMQSWIGDDIGFARIFSRSMGRARKGIMLSYRCLDPSLITRSVIANSYSTILMSGTLTPTSMYKDVLGFKDRVKEKVFGSPFPADNKLSLIIPQTSTKYSVRSDAMYKEIARICSSVTDKVPGNSAIFFPSYYLRDQVYNQFFNMSKKTVIREESGILKSEKMEILERFKLYKDKGAVLLGVSSGSYGEGIDLPGDLLKCVIVVGLPLQRPDLETKELIKYYDSIFNKGWDYGYLFPAFNRTLQAAGRCIRSETDRGVVVFLDERYVWKNYYRCFPRDMRLIVSSDYEKYIDAFYKESL